MFRKYFPGGWGGGGGGVRVVESTKLVIPKRHGRANKNVFKHFKSQHLHVEPVTGW